MYSHLFSDVNIKMIPWKKLKIMDILTSFILWMNNPSMITAEVFFLIQEATLVTSIIKNSMYLKNILAIHRVKVLRSISIRRNSRTNISKITHIPLYPLYFDLCWIISIFYGIFEESLFILNNNFGI